MNQEATEQYLSALKAGQKYYKEAVAKGKPPYPAVLDEIIGDQSLNQVDLGLTEIPAELIVGTRSAGRTAALAGNFMPLLDLGSEFATKWVSLCASHLDEGIRDPIKAYEYLGRFYVQEGNKRVSVLKSFGAPTVSGRVIRLMPPKSDDEKTKLYEEFVWFNGLTGLWNVQMTKCGSYRKLLAALGMEEDHVWTQDEQRSFRAAFTRFSSALEKLGAGKPELSAAGGEGEGRAVQDPGQGRRTRRAADRLPLRLSPGEQPLDPGPRLRPGTAGGEPGRQDLREDLSGSEARLRRSL